MNGENHQPLLSPQSSINHQSSIITHHSSIINHQIINDQCDLSWMMDFMWTASMAEQAGAGKRRRERRLRAYLRYARMSVAMALTEANHHTAPRGQNMARAGVEGHKAFPPQRPQRADARTQTVSEQDVQVAISQERNSERITEQTVDVPVPQVMESLKRACGREEVVDDQKCGVRACRYLYSACSRD